MRQAESVDQSSSIRIGQALYENAVYDESGQLETGSFRADNFLPFKLETNTTLRWRGWLLPGRGRARTMRPGPLLRRAVSDLLQERAL